MRVLIFQGNVQLYISTCQIPKGSEIFIDYGDEFWKVHNENVDSNVDEPLRAADTTTSNPVAEQSAAEVDELTVRVAPDSNARCGTIDTMPWNDESLALTRKSSIALNQQHNTTQLPPKRWLRLSGITRLKVSH